MFKVSLFQLSILLTVEQEHYLITVFYYISIVLQKYILHSVFYHIFNEILLYYRQTYIHVIILGLYFGIAD